MKGGKLQSTEKGDMEILDECLKYTALMLIIHNLQKKLDELPVESLSTDQKHPKLGKAVCAISRLIYHSPAVITEIQKLLDG